MENITRKEPTDTKETPQKANSNHGEPLPLQSKIRPIVCPQCGSKNLAYVNEYHKNILGRIIFAVCIFICLVILASSVSESYSDYATVFATVVFVVALICYIVVLLIERRTHVKAICKDCGNIWLLD